MLGVVGTWKASHFTSIKKSYSLSSQIFIFPHSVVCSHSPHAYFLVDWHGRYRIPSSSVVWPWKYRPTHHCRIVIWPFPRTTNANKHIFSSGTRTQELNTKTRYHVAAWQFIYVLHSVHVCLTWSTWSMRLRHLLNSHYFSLLHTQFHP